MAFVAAAWRSRQRGMILGVLLAGVVGLTSFIAIEIVLDRTIARQSVWADTETRQGRFLHLAIAAIWLPSVLAIAFTPYQWLLRRAVDRLLVRAECMNCRYSLQGLPIDNGGVRCPECGTRIDLAAAGLTTESIALGHPVPRPGVPPIPEQYGPYWYMPVAAALAVGSSAAWIMFPFVALLPVMLLFWLLLFSGSAAVRWIRLRRKR